MSNDLFLSLYKLFSSSNKKRPLEDFTTECLAGVLKSSPEILDSFVNTVLKIPGKNFNIKTQKSYPGSKVDMVFEDKESICFLENKVNSIEGSGQLRKYAKLLIEHKEKEGKKVFLRYCTKFKDTKEEIAYLPLSPNEFDQFRWLDVASFFKTEQKTRKAPIIPPFLDFLKEKNMDSISEFTNDDITAMNNIFGLLKKMEECFEHARGDFSRNFGEPIKKKSARLQQIRKHNRYAMWNDSVIKGTGYSEILLAFHFKHQPSIRLHCYLRKGHEKYSQFKDLIMEEFCQSQVLESEYGIHFRYEKNMKEFIQKDSQFANIKQEIAIMIQNMKRFLEEHELINERKMLTKG